MKTSRRLPSTAASARLHGAMWRNTILCAMLTAELGFAGLGLLAPCPAVAATHSKRLQATAVRIAEGQVIDAAKKPVAGAVVYLENPTSLAMRSYLTDATGHFHFAQLAPETDYEIWAEQNGVESKHKFISQFSSHTHFDFTLKLEPAKKKLLGIF